jgi:hypothetical protein
MIGIITMATAVAAPRVLRCCALMMTGSVGDESILDSIYCRTYNGNNSDYGAVGIASGEKGI